MLLELTGQRYGRLVVQERAGSDIHEKRLWRCLCDCGNVTIVPTGALRSCNTQSCGCIHREQLALRNTTHGLSNTPEYDSWKAMIHRCTNSNASDYHYYGGRGIQVCDRWRNSFEAFLADVGQKPTPNHSIDRYPNQDGHYEPGNCRWATHVEQMSNTRRTGVYEYQNKKWTAPQLAKEYNVAEPNIFTRRLKDGWDVERAINQPVGNQGLRYK